MNEKNEFNEYSQLRSVAIRNAENAFLNDPNIEQQWQALRFHAAPNYLSAIREHKDFCTLLTAHGAELVYLNTADDLTLDSIYARDALIISPNGLIHCQMGRSGRRAEPNCNATQLLTTGQSIAGSISLPGTIEGGDFLWFDEHTAAVGLGPRTNQAGIDQLKALLGDKINLVIVPLPTPNHPDDVFHLMSMISPLDVDLALIYRPLMPQGFLDFLSHRGINFVEVPESEFLPMACNVLATGPRRLIMLNNLPITKARLEIAGCHVDVYQGDEISKKGEGGPTCLTRPLFRS